MADINPNAQGKVKQAQKRLKRHIASLKTADQLTAGQRDALFVSVLLDLVRIKLFELNNLGDED